MVKKFYNKACFQGFQYAEAAAGSVPSQPPFYKLLDLIRILTNILILWHQIYVRQVFFRRKHGGEGTAARCCPCIQRREKEGKRRRTPSLRFIHHKASGTEPTPPPPV